MNKVDFFGHWFYASLFLGMLLLSAKDYRGWAFRFAGEVGWIGIGLVIGMSSIVIWGFAFMAVDVWGYLAWQQEQETQAMEERLEDLEDFWPEVGGPDCDGKIHVPGCRHYKPIENGTYTMTTNEVIVYDPARTTVKKVKKNVKRKATAKRNPPVKRKAERKKVAAKRSRPANRKVRAGGRRPRK
jgi:hypothetical protein